MSPQLLAILVVAASIAAWAVFLAYTAVGSRAKTSEFPIPEPEPALAGAAAAPGGPDYVLEVAPVRRRALEDVQGVSRRQFLNRAWVMSLFVRLGQFGLASLDFLWPRSRGGFGSKITVDMSPDELAAQIEEKQEPVYVSDGRFFPVPFVGDSKKAAQIPAYKQAATLETGILAIYRKCVHRPVVQICPMVRMSLSRVEVFGQR